MTILSCALSISTAAHASALSGCAHELAGDLSPKELQAIQKVVDETQMSLFVIGSAAQSRRRNLAKKLAIGKGFDERSDIDYLIPVQIPRAATAGLLVDGDPLHQNLPDLDHGIFIGPPDLNRARIWFRPGLAPLFIEARQDPRPDDQLYPSPHTKAQANRQIETLIGLTKGLDETISFSRKIGARGIADYYAGVLEALEKRILELQTQVSHSKYIAPAP